MSWPPSGVQNAAFQHINIKYNCTYLTLFFLDITSKRPNLCQHLLSPLIVLHSAFVHHAIWNSILYCKVFGIKDGVLQQNQLSQYQLPPDQLLMRSTPTRSTSHEINSMQFLIYKYTSIRILIWRIIYHNVGMFAAILYCHTIRDPVMPHCISVELLLTLILAITFLLQMLSHFMSHSINGGWSGETLISWELVNLVGSWSCGSWFHESWSRGPKMNKILRTIYTL